MTRERVYEKMQFFLSVSFMKNNQVILFIILYGAKTFFKLVRKCDTTINKLRVTNMYIQLNNLASIMEGLSKQPVFYDSFRGEFFQSDNPEQQDDDRYILVTNFDEDKIMNMYIDQLNDKKIQRKILKLLSNTDYIGRFHVFINDYGLYDDFIQYSQQVKLKIAEEWCNKNNLKCTLKKN